MCCAARLSLILHSCQRDKKTVKNNVCYDRSSMCTDRRSTYPEFLTIFVHASLETLLQSTSLALVSMCLVNRAPACSSLAPVIRFEKF